MAKKRRKSKIAERRERLAWSSDARQLQMPIGETIQTTTMQVPVAEYSLIDTMKTGEIPMGCAATYLIINENSHWASGKSHALSYTDIAKRSGRPRSQIVSDVRWLCENGWLTKQVQGKGRANIYQVTHHQCDPLEAPHDRDGYPKMCAVPRGLGSPSEKLENGEITWKAWLYWIISKVESNWTTGVIEMTINKAREWLKFGRQTLCDIRKQLVQVGLLQQLSGKFKAFIGQLYPKPYEKRRPRRHENPKSMKLIDGFYYSFNEMWRVSRETGVINTRVPASNRWRHANEQELKETNEKIYKDFKPVIQLALSPHVQRLRAEANA